MDTIDIGYEINKRLNGNKCPDGKSLGECAAVSDATGHYGNPYKVATIYWWKTPPNPQEVRRWVEEAGWACYSIENVLYCDDGTCEDDKLVTWNVSYGPRDPLPLSSTWLSRVTGRGE